MAVPIRSKRTYTNPVMAEAKSKPTTQEERDEAMKKNWGTEAYKTIQKFRKIWDKEGAKLE